MSEHGSRIGVLDGEGGPLRGVRVLDLTRVLAGPWCTQCLADLGAEVLKVESPEGDETRSWGPPYIGDTGTAAYFTCANRSKVSLVLDLKSPEAQAKVRALAAEADILVENFKLGTLERWGLGYDELAAINPKLVYCSITGYGRTGSQAARAGYDYLIQAETGLMSITGFPDGSPTRVGLAVSDLFAGLYASQAILAALFDQRRTGKGCRIDTALYDCQLSALANIQATALATGESPARFGNAHATVVPYAAFEAADGMFVLALGNDRQFRKLCEVLGDLELRDDPRMANNGARLERRDELTQRLASHFAKRPREYWLQKFLEAELPAGVLRTVDEALTSRQVQDRDLIHSFGDCAPGNLRVIAYPVKLSCGLPEPGVPPQHGEGGEALAEEWLQTPLEEAKHA